MDGKDLTKDTSGTRAFAMFMIDLSEKIPDLMLPSISVIMGLLDGEVCVLELLTWGPIEDIIRSDIN